MTWENDCGMLSQKKKKIAGYTKKVDRIQSQFKIEEEYPKENRTDC